MPLPGKMDRQVGQVEQEWALPGATQEGDGGIHIDRLGEVEMRDRALGPGHRGGDRLAHLVHGRGLARTRRGRRRATGGGALDITVYHGGELVPAFEGFDAVRQGLLGYPAMRIEGNASNAQQFNWYQDRAGAVPAVASVYSVSLWFYRAAMLAWALWLAFALLGWLRWGWGVFARDGLWRRLQLPTLRVGRRPDKPGDA